MWDDFTCTCPPMTAGRRCEEVRWCELSPCPTDSECRMLNQGYECKWHLCNLLVNNTVYFYKQPWMWSCYITSSQTNHIIKMSCNNYNVKVTMTVTFKALITFSTHLHAPFWLATACWCLTAWVRMDFLKQWGHFFSLLVNTHNSASTQTWNCLPLTFKVYVT